MSRSGDKRIPASRESVFPAEAGLSQAWPGPPGGTHFFPAAGWPRDARGPASLFDKISISVLVL